MLICLITESLFIIACFLLRISEKNIHYTMKYEQPKAYSETSTRQLTRHGTGKCGATNCNSITDLNSDSLQ